MTCNTALSRGHSARHLPGEAPWPRQRGGRFRLRQTAHSNRIPGTSMPDEDCDFLQMAEVPPASSVNAVLVSTFSISPPSPAHRRKCHDWRLFRVDQPRPATLPLPTTSPDQPQRPHPPQQESQQMPYGPRIVANRDTSPQKRQACTDVEAFASPARMSAPLDTDVSQHICGIRTLTGRSNLRQPPSLPREHNPRPHSTSQVTLDLWTIRSLPDRR